MRLRGEAQLRSIELYPIYSAHPEPMEKTAVNKHCECLQFLFLHVSLFPEGAFSFAISSLIQIVEIFLIKV